MSIPCIETEKRRYKMPLELGGGMVSIPAGADYHTFILRCWQEADGDQDEEPV